MFRLVSILTLLLTAAAARIHGVIESCSGWALSKLPILRSFLKDLDGAGADAYENLDVVFISGRQAILTIYDVPDEGSASSEEGGREGWIEKEKIVLSDYETKVIDYDHIYFCCTTCNFIIVVWFPLYCRMICILWWLKRGKQRAFRLFSKHSIMHTNTNSWRISDRFQLKSEFERETLRLLWEWDREQDYEVEEDELMMMKQKIAQELREKEMKNDEL